MILNANFLFDLTCSKTSTIVEYTLKLNNETSGNTEKLVLEKNSNPHLVRICTAKTWH